MVAREGDRLSAERSRHGVRSPRRHRLPRAGPAGQHDAGARGRERVDVGLVAGAVAQVLTQQGVVAAAVVLGRQAELGRVDRRELVAVGQQAVVADEDQELRHRGSHALALVGLVHVLDRRGERRAVGQDRGQRRLVRDERAHLVATVRHPRQRVHRPAAAGQDVDRSPTDRLDDAPQVARVVVGRDLTRAVAARTATGAAHVVGDHRAVGEVAGQGAEALRAHRRSDEQQRDGVAERAAHVVGDRRAGRVEGVGADRHRHAHNDRRRPPNSSVQPARTARNCESRPAGRLSRLRRGFGDQRVT